MTTRLHSSRRLTLTIVMASALAFTAAESQARTPDVPAAATAITSSFGSYMAGRLASNHHDTAEAARYFEQALAAEPDNDGLLEQAFLMQAMEGHIDIAIGHARRLVKNHPTHRMAQAWLGVAAFKAGAYADADKHFVAASSGPIAELTSTLARAWTALAAGNADQALKLVEYPNKAEWATAFANYHKALIADVAGRSELAKTYFENVIAQDPRTVRAALAYSASLAVAGKRAEAQKVLDQSLARSGGEGHPTVRAMRDTIASGKPVERLVSNPTEGMAEIFNGLGEALASEGGVPIATIYLRLALMLRPELPGAMSALAVVYEQTKRHERAIETLAKIPEDSPLAAINQIRRASNLNALDRVDEAKAVLLKLINASRPAATKAAASKPVLSEADASGLAQVIGASTKTPLRRQPERVKRLQSVLQELGYQVGTPDGKLGSQTISALRKFQRDYKLEATGQLDAPTLAAFADLATGKRTAVAQAAGDATASTLSADERRDRILPLDALAGIMRARKRFDEAAGYYTEIINLIDKPDRRHWTYFYARGTCYERLKQWAPAERDLKTALALNKDQPLVLNYLGYSWIDQGRNLKQGMKLIERAVALKPEDGYIVDSLGWAHYRLGNYKTAVTYLEKAVELRADDPILNDHLGDALWQVGRRREARYQWEQALTLKPEEDDAARIRAKLDTGLIEPRKVAAPTKRARPARQSNAAKPGVRKEN